MTTLLRSADTAQSESVWAATAEMPRAPTLTRDMDADVAVVGAGIAGLTTGYLLAKAGKHVVLLDDGPLAGGMTQMTTAHLSAAIDDHFTESRSRPFNPSRKSPLSSLWIRRSSIR